VGEVRYSRCGLVVGKPEVQRTPLSKQRNKHSFDLCIQTNQEELTLPDAYFGWLFQR